MKRNIGLQLALYPTPATVALPKADLVGSVSSAKSDKAAVFEYNLGEAGGKCLSFKKWEK